MGTGSQAAARTGQPSAPHGGQAGVAPAVRPAAGAAAATGREATARPCPVCSAEAPPHLRVAGHVYLCCPRCRHQFLDYLPPSTHVSDHYSDGYFQGGGDGYADYLAERDLLVRRGQWYARAVAKATGRTRGRMLDVGSAAGFHAAGFRASGWDVEGVEPSAAMARHARENESVPTANQTIEDFEEPRSYDLVSLIQVVGHLPDPAATMGKASRLLTPGGLLLVETWDCASLTARVLRRLWHEYNPPSVLQIFSRDSLAAAVCQHGLEVVVTRGTRKSITAGHARAVVDHKLRSWRVARPLLAPLRLLPDSLPLPYPADDLFYLIAQKP